MSEWFNTTQGDDVVEAPDSCVRGSKGHTFVAGHRVVSYDRTASTRTPHDPALLPPSVSEPT